MVEGEELSPQQLIELVSQVVSRGVNVRLFKRDCAQLTRRFKLILPLLEEVRDLKTGFPGEAFLGLVTATQRAKQLVSFCQTGSKLYLVMKKEYIAKEFHEIALQLAKALESLPLNEMGVSDELREQVELVLSQLQRSKPSINVFENMLHEDFMQILLTPNDLLDPAVLKRLADNLNLKTASDWRKESRALEKMRAEHGAVRTETVMQKLKAVVLPENVEPTAVEIGQLTAGHLDGSSVIIAPPNDFRCPISLELMKDPVIVATGQTYERSSIQKWFDAGHRTCPKTQQVLPHLVLTPNYVLRSLIAQWCESNGLDLATAVGASRGSTPICRPDGSLVDRAKVDFLIKALSSDIPNLQRAAAEEIRQLTKDSSEDRACIAGAGAIPFLVSLLGTKDLVTQEHAVTALLNLSIYDVNKNVIVSLGAVDPIVEVLKSGSMEARQNAAATLFSLSGVDENKVIIGASEAIPALGALLRDGTTRASKKDAATALYNLCLYQANKARAVRAGVVPQLLQLVVDRSMDLVDESLATLAMLPSHPEGRVAMAEAGVVPVLVDLIKSGSDKSKENAARILHDLSTGDRAHLVTAQQLGVYDALKDLAKSGSERARKKASSLLEQFSSEVCS